MTTDKEREAFEAWATDNGLVLDKWNDGFYKHPETIGAWTLWQDKVAKQDGWRPIESAPKDGTKIDLWVEGKRYTDVYWCFSTNAITGERIYDPIWEGWAQEGWSGMSYTPNYLPDKGMAATHFQYLPQPPKQGE